MVKKFVEKIDAEEDAALDALFDKISSPQSATRRISLAGHSGDEDVSIEVTDAKIFHHFKEKRKIYTGIILYGHHKEPRQEA